MKKILALILALVLCFSLCACGEGTTEEPADPASSGEEVTAGNEPEASDFKAGFIFLHDENSTYDLNFINGVKDACAQLGIEPIMKTNIPEGQECYEAACELADMGCNFVFADSFGHDSFMLQAAKDNPDVQFVQATGTLAHTSDVPNYHNAFASIYEGRYLAGIAAGMKLNQMIADGQFTAEEAKMGYVGAYTYAEVISGYTSFFLGARSVCPTVTMDVTFTGSWYDETAEKEGALKLINNGCKLISQHADSMGAPTACENAGVPDVTYNGSTKNACPNTYICYSKIDWAPFFVYAINAIKNGEELPADWTGTFATGSVVMTDINEAVAAPGTVEAVEAAKAGLIDGSIKVFDTDTFTVEGAKVESYQADVDTDDAYTPDTEVIEDGEFVESKYRSAPYFDLKIDGINLLDTRF